jgi:hypothetical protein
VEPSRRAQEEKQNYSGSSGLANDTCWAGEANGGPRLLAKSTRRTKAWHTAWRKKVNLGNPVANENQ